MPGDDQNAVAEAMRYLASRLNPDVAKTIEGARTVTGDPVPSGATIRPLSRLERLQKYLGDAVEPIANQPVMQAMAALGDIFDQGLRGNLRELPGAKTGAIVYHGSPHKFDKFDMSKIGTGEGAQAYGHGLYFAENPNVALDYQKRLATGFVDKGGAQVAYGDAWSSAQKAAHSAGAIPDHARAIADQIQKWVESGKKADTFLKVHEVPPGLQGAYQEAINAFKGLKSNPGNLYKVDLPDDQIAKMLDWDAPLSQQAPEVQKILGEQFGFRVSPEAEQVIQKARAQLAELEAAADRSVNAAAIYRKMDRLKDLIVEMGGGSGREMYQKIASAPEASKRLGELGIPGIKYLDQGSRATSGGRIVDVFERPGGVIPGHAGAWHSKVEARGDALTSPGFASRAEAERWAMDKINGGTRNYVAFRDDIVKILERK